MDWAQKRDAQLDLCAVISPRDPWRVFEGSLQGMRQQVCQVVGVKRWLSILRDAIPAAHRGEVTVLDKGAITELAAHVKESSALLIGRSERCWWASLQPTVADQTAHGCPGEALRLASPRAGRVELIGLSNGLAPTGEASFSEQIADA